MLDKIGNIGNTQGVKVRPIPATKNTASTVIRLALASTLANSLSSPTTVVAGSDGRELKPTEVGCKRPELKTKCRCSGG
jgi:hypothetical protein